MRSTKRDPWRLRPQPSRKSSAGLKTSASKSGTSITRRSITILSGSRYCRASSASWGRGGVARSGWGRVGGFDYRQRAGRVGGGGGGFGWGGAGGGGGSLWGGGIGGGAAGVGGHRRGWNPGFVCGGAVCAGPLSGGGRFVIAAQPGGEVCGGAAVGEGGI